MSFAEVVLCLGVAFVAWLVVYMHFVMMFAVQIARCPNGDTGPWLVSLISAVMTIGASFLTAMGSKVPGVGHSLRGMAVPLLLLVPWAGWVVWPFVMPMTIAGIGPCAVILPDEYSGGAGPWTRWWAPVQIVTLVLLTVNSMRQARQERLGTTG